MISKGKVLFVCREGESGQPKTVVRTQAETLRRAGTDIEFFLIRYSRIRGYLKEIRRLRKHLKIYNYDLIHAHYGLSGIVATLAGAKPLVVSFMGSDLYRFSILLPFYRFLIRKVWSYTIVKTSAMSNMLKSNRIVIIPNGVDLDLFKAMPAIEARLMLEDQIGKDDNIILFSGDPIRSEKNFKLAEEAVALLDLPNTRLIALKGISFERMYLYLNAANLLLITSLYEGSPNVLKEALACNCPVVSTNVGDAMEQIGNSSNCYVTGFDPGEIASRMNEILKRGERSNGRDNILHLSSDIIAIRIIDVYNLVTKDRRFEKN